jgi:hypothetical protein
MDSRLAIAILQANLLLNDPDEAFRKTEEILMNLHLQEMQEIERRYVRSQEILGVRKPTGDSWWTRLLSLWS